MADNFTSIPDLTQEFTAKSQEVSRQRSEFVDTITRGGAQVQDTHSALINALTQESQNVNQSFNEIIGIKEKAESALRVPGVVRSFLGIFDSDFDLDSLRQRASRETTRIQAAESRIDKVKEIAGATLTKTADEIKTSAQRYTAAQQGFGDTQQSLQSFRNLSATQQEEMTRLVNNTDEATLGKWMKNPDAAPGNLRGNAGLIQDAYITKLSRSLSIQGQRSALALQGQALAENERKRALEGLTHEQLAAIASGKAPLPKNLQLGDVQSRLDMKNQVQLGLESAKLSIQAGRHDLAQRHLTSTLNSLTQNDLKTLLAQEGNAIDLGNGLKLTRQHLQAALNARKQSDAEASKAEAERIIAEANVESNYFEFGNAINAAAKLTAPEVMPQANKMGDLTPVLAPEHQRMIKQAEEITKALANADPTARAVGAQKAKEIGDQIRKDIEKNLGTPYEKKILWGQTPTVSERAEFVEKNAPSGTWLADNPLFAAPAERFATAFNSIVTTKSERDFNINSSDKTFKETTTTAPKGATAINMALEQKDPVTGKTARQSFGDAVTMEALRQTMLTLAQRAEAQKIPNVWDDFIDARTGQWRARVTQVRDVDMAGKSQARRVFNMGNLNALMAEKSVGLSLNAGETLNEIFYNTLPDVGAQVDQRLRADYRVDAMLTMALGPTSRGFLNQIAQREMNNISIEIIQAQRFREEQQRIQTTNDQITKTVRSVTEAEEETGQGPGYGAHPMIQDFIRRQNPPGALERMQLPERSR